VGPKNLELAGEIADGWLAVFYAPDYAAEQLASVAAGRARVGRELAGFDVVPSVPLVVGDDIASCGELVRWYAALYVGGMGSREQNFYNQLAIRMGYGDAARQVQELYLDQRQRDAAAAVPLEFIDRTSLLGPKERIADRMREYAAAGVTTLSVTPFVADVESGIRTLRACAEALDLAGVGE
jgi:alkanesulfonate monooxygenase SsuD/methylene tetrahydromethanopterin reductase-like flavin-dependent oxidoreductase (luciferase family)